jgi:hypothetical protein
MENHNLGHQALGELGKVAVYVIEAVEYVCSLVTRY